MGPLPPPLMPVVELVGVMKTLGVNGQIFLQFLFRESNLRPCDHDEVHTFVDSVDGLYTVMSLNPKPLRNGFGFKLITVYKHIDIINKSVRLY